MKIGLYFGTFNPIHVGHLIIANHMSTNYDLDQVWLVVSPQNPLKNKKTLLADYHRLALVNIAIEDNPQLKVSNIEFNLPKPSYTVDSLAYLQEKYPSYEFSMLMGEDNLRTLHKWKNYTTILDNHKVYVYPRALTQEELTNQLQKKESATKEHPNVILTESPVMKISASYIRNAIKEKKEVRYLLTDPVLKYVSEMNFYKK